MKLGKVNKKKNTMKVVISPETMNDYEDRFARNPAYHQLYRNIAEYFGRKDHNDKEAFRVEGDYNDGDSHYGIRDKKFPSWYFIPLNTSHLVQTLATVREYTLKIGTHNKNLRFMDAGCGPGNAMLLANAMNLTRSGIAHGIELDKEGANIGRILTGCHNQSNKIQKVLNNRTHIFNTDIVTFKYYKKYDIIYYYCPIKLHPLQILFEERLEDVVKVGTIIIPRLKQSECHHIDDRFLKVAAYTGKSVNSFRSANQFIVKMKNTPRTITNVVSGDLDRLPAKYVNMAIKHMERVKKNAKRIRNK